VNNNHPTPFSSHLKEKHFWFDILLLTLLWGVAFFWLPRLNINYQASWTNLVRICALIGTIQLIGFISFHFLGQKSGLLIQGLLGGFVSSTATFIQFSKLSIQNKEQSFIVCRSLILATISMLLQGLLIIWTLKPTMAFALSLPLLIQLFVLLIFFLFYTRKKSDIQSPQIGVTFDDAIIWKNVFSFGLMMTFMTFAMRFLNDSFSIPYSLSVFTMSLFEAHSVLAAVINELSPLEKLPRIEQMLLIILAGSALSKIFLTLRSKTPALKIPLISALAISWLCSFLFTNCSQFNDELFSSELFGHKKGSFTGANDNKVGLLEKAHNGIIFFDEIHALSMKSQKTLLKVIEEKEISLEMIKRHDDSLLKAAGVMGVSYSNLSRFLKKNKDKSFTQRKNQ
jgi:predicted ATP-dependent protease